MPESWDDHYRSGDLPWDTGVPDPALVAILRGGAFPRGRALDIGAGTGTNARWLAEQGFDVLGIDLAPRAVELARAATPAAIAARCRFAVGDFLAEPPAGPFALVFDRGCFHCFGDPAERARFAAHVARVLAPDGAWLSLIGSTEGPPNDLGPPRRSARDIVQAIEPVLAIHALTAQGFADLAQPAPAWACIARPRAVPAQPSSQS